MSAAENIVEPFDTVRRAELYALFMDDWIEREFERLRLAGAREIADTPSADEAAHDPAKCAHAPGCWPALPAQ